MMEYINAVNCAIVSASFCDITRLLKAKSINTDSTHARTGSDCMAFRIDPLLPSFPLCLPSQKASLIASSNLNGKSSLAVLFSNLCRRRGHDAFSELSVNCFINNSN